MNDFRSAYQQAVQDMNLSGMKELHIDASSCMDEKRHRRRVMKRVQRATTTAFSAMCVVFICGFGTVKAAEYIENVIKVNDWGFESADVVTMARNEADSGLLGDNVSVVVEEEIAAEQAESEEAQPQLASAEPAEAAGMPQTVEAEVVEAEIEEAEVEEIPVKNYTSWEEFEKNEDIIFSRPSVSIGENIVATDITVCGEWAMVRYDVDGKVLWMERTDYADTQGHASSKVFPGGVCNEREYKTAQGYTYTLIDSVKEKEEEQLQIHAAITVGTYEVYADFIGYTEDEAEQIIESIDLKVYE